MSLVKKRLWRCNARGGVRNLETFPQDAVKTLSSQRAAAQCAAGATKKTPRSVSWSKIVASTSPVAGYYESLQDYRQRATKHTSQSEHAPYLTSAEHHVLVARGKTLQKRTFPSFPIMSITNLLEIFAAVATAINSVHCARRNEAHSAISIHRNKAIVHQLPRETVAGVPGPHPSITEFLKRTIPAPGSELESTALSPGH